MDRFAPCPHPSQCRSHLAARDLYGFVSTASRSSYCVLRWPLKRTSCSDSPNCAESGVRDPFRTDPTEERTPMRIARADGERSPVL